MGKIIGYEDVNDSIISFNSTVEKEIKNIKVNIEPLQEEGSGLPSPDVQNPLGPSDVISFITEASDRIKDVTVDIEPAQEGSGDPSRVAYDIIGPSGVVSATDSDRIKNIIVNIEPIQSGSDDPSPDNVRPITGWTGASVTRTGANLWGGTALASDLVAKSAVAQGSDDYGSYVRLAAPYASKRIYFSKFKPNTVYTVILTLKKSNTSGLTNLTIHYTDGTSQNIARNGREADVVETFAFTTTAGKSIDYIGGSNQSGYTYLYYDECGVFEGALTVDDYVAYADTNYSVSWETEAGEIYGGTLDVVRGTLIVTHAKRTYLSSAYWAWNESISGFVPGQNDMAAGSHYSDQASMCSCFKKALSASATTDPCVVIGNSSAKQIAFCNLTSIGITDVETWKTFLDTHDVSVTYPIADPITYQLTPQEITILLGSNNIYADCGQMSLTRIVAGNIRNITGWTGTNVTRTGVNIFGGTLLRDGIKAAMPNATIDEDEKYISFGAAANVVQNFTAECGLTRKFKEATRYTFIMSIYKTAGTGSNMRVYYTDGSFSNVPDVSEAGVKKTVVLVTAANKTVSSITKTNRSGATRVYYDESGVFEGALTAADFTPYGGTTYPVSWETEAGTVYGGTLDVMNGTLTVDRGFKTFNSTDGWTLLQSGLLFHENVFGLNISTAAGTDNGFASNMYLQENVVTNSSVAANRPSGTFFNQYINTSNRLDRCYIRDDDITTIEEFGAALAANPLQVTYPLDTPVTYQLTPQEVTTLLGANNVWADYGKISLTHVVAGNTRPITGWTEASMRVSGKNLWDDSLYALAGWNLVTEGERAGYYNGNTQRFCRTVFSWNGSYGTGLLGTKCDFGQLTISFDSYPTSGAIQVYFYYSDGTSVNIDGNLTGKRHISYSSNPSKNCVGVSISTTVGATAASQYFKNLQIEIGGEETEYEPYTGTTYPLSWENEIGTIYGGNTKYNIDGSIDLEVNKIKVDLTSLTWQNESIGQNNKIIKAELPNSYNADNIDNNDVISSTYLYRGKLDLLNSEVDTLEKGIYLHDSTNTSIIYIVTGIHDEPQGEVVYLIKDSTTYNFPNAYTYPITAKLGVNNIFSNTEEISLSYPRILTPVETYSNINLLKLRRTIITSQDYAPIINAELNLGTHEVYSTDSIESLRKYLNVTLNGSNRTITDYTLHGSIGTTGTRQIIVDAHPGIATIQVPVITNPSGILYDWDFTKSLIDDRQYYTAILKTGEADEVPGKSEGTTPPVRGDTGVVFNQQQQAVRLLDSDVDSSALMYGKTIQVDVAEYNYAYTSTDGTAQSRFIMFGDPVGNNGAMLYALGLAMVKNTVYANYSWCFLYANREPGRTNTIYDSTVLLSGMNAISGHTIGLYINTNGNIKLYVDGNLSGVSNTFTMPNDLKGLQIGAGGRPQYGGSFYNARITGARIYDGNIYE